MANLPEIKVLGISGSLRRESYNTAALREAIGLAPSGMHIEMADIAEIPLYNEDVFALGFPPAVERIRQQIRVADALLWATPEYNYSVLGVLKNAIDWASRPPDNPLPASRLQFLGPVPDASVLLVRSITCAKVWCFSMCT
ncbi:NADPH-dependent FMN reductase [compost metagenome]